jgi:hypothetical protein
MTLSVKIALALGIFWMAGTATAGPWCSSDSGYAPQVGTTLPVHPRVIVFMGDKFYASKVSKRATTAKVTATIDGKKVPVAIKTARVGNQVIQTIEIKSDKTGELVVKTGKDDEATWTISSEWAAPEKINATVSRYHRDRLLERHAWYDGANLKLDQPALTLRAKWRRDSKDTWRTVVVPVMTDTHDLTLPGDAKAPPETIVLLGESRCGADTIPRDLLEQGIELEATVLLPNGKEAAVAGLPSPVVIEKKKYKPNDPGDL